MPEPKSFVVECTNYPVKFYVQEWLERRGHKIGEGGWKLRVDIIGEEIELLCYGSDDRQICAAHSNTLMLADIRSTLIRLSRDRDGQGEIF